MQADTATDIDDVVLNQAEATGPTPDPNAVNNRDGALTTPDPVADVAVVKTGPAQVTSGGTITYTLTVTNHGPSTAADVELVDSLPSGVMVRTIEADPLVSCTLDGGQITCALGDLEVDESVVVTVTAEVPAADGQSTVVATATVAGGVTDPDDANNTSTVETIVNPSPPEIGRLSGTVWLDANANGVRDDGESPIAGVVVIVTGNPDGDGVDESYTATTDDAGQYTFDLRPGDWTVSFDEDTLPAGALPTTPISTTITAGADAEAVVNLGVAITGTLSGRVWFDLDGDGVVDPGESNIVGVEVTVTFAGSDGILGTADDVVLSQTAHDGTFVFEGVPTGQPYEVRVDPSTLPAGLRPTYDGDAVLDNKTSGVIEDGTVTAAVRFGYRQPPPQIAFTGASTSSLLRFALLLLALGGGLILMRHRPRRGSCR